MRKLAAWPWSETRGEGIPQNKRRVAACDRGSRAAQFPAARPGYLGVQIDFPIANLREPIHGERELS
jgi:hypothetical protein